MSTATLAPPNAILFLFDVSNKAVTIPNYVDGQLVSSNDSCISVGTQASVDGDVTISLETAPSSRAMFGTMKAFSGRIRTPGHKLAVVTSDGRTVLECSVVSENPELEVWTDDSRNPAQVAIVVK